MHSSFFVLVFSFCKSVEHVSFEKGGHHIVYYPLVDKSSDTLKNLDLVKVISIAISHRNCNDTIFASQAICFRPATDDTIRVVTPCIKYMEEKRSTIGEVGYLWGSKNPKEDTVWVASNNQITKYKEHRFTIVFGQLTFPKDDVGFD